MPSPLLSYGWAYPAATLNSPQLQRAFPSWLNDYGYQGSLATNEAKTFANPGVDPYSLLPRHDTPTTTPSAETAPQNGFNALMGTAGGAAGGSEANIGGLNATGAQPDWGGLLGGAKDAFAGLGNAIAGGMGFGGGDGPPNASAGDVAAAAGPGGGSNMQFNRGGIVTRNRLTGPNPPGPDDGMAALDIGEGVLTAKAIRHYGKGVVSKLNRLAVPKSALK